MRRFKNILFVNEPGTTESSTPGAVVELARANDARLTLCEVLQPLPRNFVRLEKAIHGMRLAQLQGMLAGEDLEGLEVEYRVLQGTSFIEIIREVDRGQHDLVIKNAEPGSISFGANDMHLLRKCPVPLWIAKSDNFGRYRNIVAAVDVDPEAPANRELNRLIMDLAVSLARESGCRLHVVHAWSVPNEGLLRGVELAFGHEQLDELVETTGRNHEDWLEELLKGWDLSDIDHQLHVGKGRPSQYIQSITEMVDADLVVMGTVTQTDVPGFFIGNTAERILSLLGSSVLSVKPSTFRSPVL
jgi:nucleotide-binding universal stress UspA family protein